MDCRSELCDVVDVLTNNLVELPANLKEKVGRKYMMVFVHPIGSS